MKEDTKYFEKTEKAPIINCRVISEEVEIYDLSNDEKVEPGWLEHKYHALSIIHSAFLMESKDTSWKNLSYDGISSTNIMMNT